MSDFDYNVRNALLWGNCQHNFEKANDDKNSIPERIGFGILGVLESIPIAGQLISLGETGIINLIASFSSQQERTHFLGTTILSTHDSNENTSIKFKNFPQPQDIHLAQNFLRRLSFKYEILANNQGSYEVKFTYANPQEKKYMYEKLKLLLNEEIEEDTDTFSLTSDQIFKLLLLDDIHSELPLVYKTFPGTFGVISSDLEGSKERLNTLFQTLIIKQSEYKIHSHLKQVKDYNSFLRKNYVNHEINVIDEIFKEMSSDYVISLSLDPKNRDQKNYELKFKHETEQDMKILKKALEETLKTKFESSQIEDEGKTLNLNSNQIYSLLGYPRDDVYQNRFDALMQALISKSQKS